MSCDFWACSFSFWTASSAALISSSGPGDARKPTLPDWGGCPLGQHVAVALWWDQELLWQEDHSKANLCVLNLQKQKEGLVGNYLAFFFPGL